MDPIVASKLAATTVDFIHPFLSIIATKASEEIGKKLPEAVTKLWEKLHNRMNRKPAAKEALQDLLANPDDPDVQAAVRVQLSKLLKSESFAAELQELLQAAQNEIESHAGNPTTVIGSGSIAQSGGVAASGGGIAVGGNVSGDIRQQIEGDQKINGRKAK
jgi:hypothetical protein